MLLAAYLITVTAATICCCLLIYVTFVVTALLENLDLDSRDLVCTADILVINSISIVY